MKPKICGIILLHNKKVLTVMEKGWFKTGFPKGKKMSDEPYFEAACRELKEETNINLDKINYQRRGKIKKSNMHLFIVSADKDAYFPIKLDYKEVIGYGWVNVSDLNCFCRSAPKFYNQSVKYFIESKIYFNRYLLE